MSQLRNPMLMHNFQEANKVAHLLAKESTKLVTLNKASILPSPRPMVEAVVNAGAEGTSYSRSISEAVSNILTSMGNVNAVNSISTFVSPHSFDPNGM
ncbi:hypothetical protein A4A49_64796, partial [Nicotiana attenuata]